MARCMVVILALLLHDVVGLVCAPPVCAAVAETMCGGDEAACPSASVDSGGDDSWGCCEGPARRAPADGPRECERCCFLSDGAMPPVNAGGEWLQQPAVVTAWMGLLPERRDNAARVGRALPFRTARVRRSMLCIRTV